MDFSGIFLELMKSVDGKTLAVDAALLSFIIKQHFLHANKISQLESEIAVLKEKAYHSEKDITSLETLYNQDVRQVFFKYSDGKIYNS